VAARDRTRLAGLRQQGCLKLLFPRVAPDEPLQGVMVNTSGGIVGGDRLGIEVRAGPGTRTLLTTQAAERCYRARAAGEVAHLHTTIALAAGAALEWLPQETILFDGSGLDRSLRIDMAGDASLLAVESRVFGRTAHGERLASVNITDRLVLRRDGRPVLVDCFRLRSGAELDRPATANGAVAAATILFAASDAARHLASVREALEGDAGASAWDGMLVIRLVSRDAALHRVRIARLLGILRESRLMPAVWHC
jgi:urease accessory protein